MIALIQLLLLSATGILTGYLVLLSVLALLERNKKIPATNELSRFAIVVPAYNEEGCIANTIRNLFSIDYPDHLYDIIVIADNCTDRTASIASKEGAKVWKRNNPDERGKGYALRWCFDKLLMLTKYNSRYYDYVVVVDADSLVSGNILKVFNNYSNQGAKAIQGYLTVPPKPGSWTSETIRIGLTLYNYVRPLGRRRIGCSAGLRGNGMCFSMSTLSNVPWNAYTQTEDLEYGMALLMNDIEVVFSPEIIGYNQIPESASNAESQRERWEIGRFPVLRKYAFRLLKSGLKRRSFKLVDAFIDLITPPLVTMLIFVLFMAGISFVLWWSGVEGSLLYMYSWLTLFGFGLAHGLIGLIAANADSSMYRSLLYVPRYAVWKFYLYFKVFLLKGRSSDWIRTARE